MMARGRDWWLARLAASGLALSAMLAACQAPDPADAPVVEAPGCRLELLADLPADFADNNVAVMAEANGQPLRLAIDTSDSAPLTLQPEVARRLALPEVERGRAATLLGEVAFPHVRVDRFVLGGLAGTTVRADVLQLRADAAGGRRDGDIGWGLLGRHEVELDPAARRVRLHAASGCGDRLLPFAAPHFSVPLRFSGFGVPLMPIRANGAECLALVTSGGVTAVSRDVALRGGMTPAQLAAAPQATMTGPGGTAQSCPVPRFREVEIGEHVFRDINLPALPASSMAPDAVVGGDYLLRQQV